MAERRMFAQNIVLSDAFLDMPMSARCLYFTLGMFADDDGFIGAPKRIMRDCGASQDDMNILIAKRFVLIFESGVIVIKHWRINNYLRNDRYKETVYLEEKNALIVDANGSYTEREKPLVYQVDTNCLPPGIPSIGKDSIGKDSIGNSAHTWHKPSVSEIKAYCSERNNSVDAEKFFDFYESKGWMVGKTHMKDWKACVRTWEHSSQQNQRARVCQDDDKWNEALDENGEVDIRRYI